MFEGRSPRQGAPVIAIVGGGASGTLTAVHVLRAFPPGGRPPRLVLVDRDGRHGLGQAYATTDPRHLLNACASRMSAVAGEPDHLLDWVRSRGLDAADTDYLPRRLYGEYLRSVFDEARAPWPGDQVEEVTGSVVSLTAGDRPAVGLADGRVIRADAVVLATGNRPPAAWPRVRAGKRYVPDPWAPGALDGRGDGSPVLIVGTGLTMVDLAVTLGGAHPGTVVHAISRHGLLPAHHRCPQPPPVRTPLPEGPLTLASLMRTVRAAVRANGGEWHAVIDGLRPHVPELWERLPAGERRRFLDLASRYWEVHRHRIPPETAARVEELRASGRLRVLRGSLISAVSLGDGVLARLDTPEGPRELHVGHVVNGTGPSRDLAADPFLSALFASGAARPDPLGLGLDATPDGAVLDAGGRPHERVFTLGPPLRGLRYETTAVPEIREQAAALAPLLARVVSHPAGEALQAPA